MACAKLEQSQACIEYTTECSALSLSTNVDRITKIVGARNSVWIVR